MNRNVSELHSNDEEGGIKSNNRLSFPKTDRSVDRMIKQATKGLDVPEIEMSLDTSLANESGVFYDGTRSESAQVESQVSS